MAQTKLTLTGVPWYRRAGVWIGIGINPGSLTLGGGLASQLAFSTLLFLVPLGALVLIVLAVAQGIIGRRRREGLAERAASTFGSGFGAGLLNLLMALSLIGWGSFYVGIAGFSLANLLNLPVWVGALAIVSTLFILSELGINRWTSLGNYDISSRPGHCSPGRCRRRSTAGITHRSIGALRILVDYGQCGSLCHCVCAAMP